MDNSARGHRWVHECDECTNLKRKLQVAKLYFTEKLKNFEEKLEEKKFKIKDLKTQIESLQKEVESVQKRYKISGADVKSVVLSKEDLKITNFQNYYEKMLITYPATQTISDNFLSGTHKTKKKASSTNFKWKELSAFYKSFLVDVFLKSKNKIAVPKTHYYLGLFCWHAGCPEPIWKLFQRLRILPSKEIVEKWLKNLPPPQMEINSIKILALNNCDKKIHVSHVRKEHRSKMLHLINWFIIETLVESTLWSSEVWGANNMVNFRHYVQGTPDWALKIANSSVATINECGELNEI